MESSLFDGPCNTHINMRWEWRGSHSQRYFWGSEDSAWRVRNRVFDEEGNSSTRTRLRSVKPDKGVTRERYLGVRDVLREESFC